MHKIVISGYYGFNNIGDESILTAVVNSLREKLDDIEITVLSASPESTAAKYGVKSVNRRSFTSVMRAVRKCDLLISGGGSLLRGLDRVIAKTCGIDTFVADDAISAVAIGTGKYVDKLGGFWKCKSR